MKRNSHLIDLLIDFPSTHLTLPNVEIAFFNYFLEKTEANYLYMSNTSSYINLKNLNSLVSKLPKNQVYGGSLKFFEDIKFFSESNRILSRDLVKFLVENFNLWDFNYMEEVSMGKLLSTTNCIEIEIPSLEFVSAEEIESTNKKNLDQVVHFRLKSGTLKHRFDVELMNHLHKKITLE